MKLSPYDIIKRFIEKFILTKYPFLKIHSIDSYNLANNREYDVRFLTKKKLSPQQQMDIHKEIKNLFKMSGLNEIEKNTRNTILIWFKTPREESFSYHFPPYYIEN